MKKILISIVAIMIILSGCSSKNKSDNPLIQEHYNGNLLYGSASFYLLNIDHNNWKKPYYGYVYNAKLSCEPIYLLKYYTNLGEKVTIEMQKTPGAYFEAVEYTAEELNEYINFLVNEFKDVCKDTRPLT